MRGNIILQFSRVKKNDFVFVEYVVIFFMREQFLYLNGKEEHDGRGRDSSSFFFLYCHQFEVPNVFLNSF